VGFSLDAAKSIPIVHLPLNSNMGVQVYIRALLFRYAVSEHSLSYDGDYRNG
jgi:hypothetical protein